MCPSKKNWKLMASVQSALIFAVIASPQLFALMQDLLGGLIRITSGSGVPTTAGLLLHAAVYGLIVYVLMHYKKKRCAAKMYGGNTSYTTGTGYGHGTY